MPLEGLLKLRDKYAALVAAGTDRRTYAEFEDES